MEPDGLIFSGAPYSNSVIRNFGRCSLKTCVAEESTNEVDMV